MNKTISLALIRKMTQESDYDVRTVAMNACQGRDIPLDIIKIGLQDSDCDVRSAATNACTKCGYSVPIIRTIEPPETVYKKCGGDVIVCASIPNDAQIRGSVGNKCRASKAIITKIIGTIYGEPIGISKYDFTTIYSEGDVVEIDDFDYGDCECSTGFHFFCTKQEAKNYA